MTASSEVRTPGTAHVFESLDGLHSLAIGVIPEQLLIGLGTALRGRGCTPATISSVVPAAAVLTPIGNRLDVSFTIPEPSMPATMRQGLAVPPVVPARNCWVASGAGPDVILSARIQGPGVTWSQNGNPGHPPVECRPNRQCRDRQ